MCKNVRKRGENKRNYVIEKRRRRVIGAKSGLKR